MMVDNHERAKQMAEHMLDNANDRGLAGLVVDALDATEPTRRGSTTFWKQADAAARAAEPRDEESTCDIPTRIVKEVGLGLACGASRAKLRRRVKAILRDATEPKPEPKARPAYIGDEVNQRVGGRVYANLVVIGPGKNRGAVCYTPAFHDIYSGLDTATLFHPDGDPVSEIIVGQRPIKTSERRPTREDADEGGRVLARLPNHWRWDITHWDSNYFENEVWDVWLPLPPVEEVE